MILLDVSYEEKDKVKKLGAKWNAELKKWYVDNPRDYYKFEDWLNGHIVISDRLYIIEGETTCWKCKQKAKVVALGVDKYLELCGNPETFIDDDIRIASGFEGLHKSVLDYIIKKYPVKERFSKTLGHMYLSNGCEHCDALLGDWFLFNEPESPFLIDSCEKAQKLTLYEIKLPYDLALPISVGFGSMDFVIKKNAKFVRLDI